MAYSPPLAGVNDHRGGDSWPGSKAASGASEAIVRQMPPHSVYLEPFAGHAAVCRLKAPCVRTILIDVDPAVVAFLTDWKRSRADDVTIVHADATKILPTAPALQRQDTLVYCDPPYLLETRTRLLYEHEFATAEEHKALLKVLLQAKCKVMISGYASKLYFDMLRAPRWRFFTFPSMTRGGVRLEHVWCNFPEPDVLHDPRWAGKDFRERERIKRKARRWVTRYLAMEPRERQAVIQELALGDRATLEAALRSASLLPPMEDRQ